MLSILPQEPERPKVLWNGTQVSLTVCTNDPAWQRIPEPFQCCTRRNKYLSSDTVLSRRLIPHLESFFFFPFLNQSLDAWGWCTGTTQRDGTGRKEGSGWGTRVCLWWIHVDIWQNQYNIVKLKNKIKTTTMN